jgi:hypothetical protein
MSGVLVNLCVGIDTMENIIAVAIADLRSSEVWAGPERSGGGRSASDDLATAARPL